MTPTELDNKYQALRTYINSYGGVVPYNTFDTWDGWYAGNWDDWDLRKMPGFINAYNRIAGMSEQELEAQAKYLAEQRVITRQAIAQRPWTMRFGIATGQPGYIQTRMLFGAGALIGWMLLKGMK